jgi:hypothetical protein
VKHGCHSRVQTAEREHDSEQVQNVRLGLWRRIRLSSMSPAGQRDGLLQ